MLYMKTILLLLGCMLCFPLLAGDILTLQNQMSFEGKVLKIKGCDVFFKCEGKKYLVPAEDIFVIEFENTADPVYSSYMASDSLALERCLQGRYDAEMFHGKKGGHFILGFLFGPLAMIGTACANPTPTKAQFFDLLQMEKRKLSSPNYLHCYKQKARRKLVGMEAAGWFAGVGLYFGLKYGRFLLDR